MDTFHVCFSSPVDVGFLHHGFYSVVELKENHVLRGKTEFIFKSHNSSVKTSAKRKPTLTFSRRGNLSRELTPVKQ